MKHKTQLNHHQAHKMGMRTYSGVRAGLSCTCSLQPETGPCRAYIPSYYYDINANACKEFIYGGCGGNENRFSTLKECDSACG